MKKLNLLVILVIVVCFFSGCTGFRNATVETDATGNIKEWNDSNKSLFQPSVSPTEISRANVLNSKADLNRALAAQVSSGNAASVIGSYIGIIVNQDRYYVVHVQHPSQSDIVSIEPGDYAVLRTTDIPNYIYAAYYDDKKFVKTKVYKQAKIYNGIKTDYGARLYNK